jgi:hypothetical protein
MDSVLYDARDRDEVAITCIETLFRVTRQRAAARM